MSQQGNTAPEWGQYDSIGNALEFMQGLSLPGKPAPNFETAWNATKPLLAQMSGFIQANKDDSNKHQKNIKALNAAMSASSAKDVEDYDIRGIKCFFNIAKATNTNNALPVMSKLKINSSPFNFDSGAKIAKLPGHFQKVLEFLKKEDVVVLNEVKKPDGTGGGKGGKNNKKKNFFKGKFAEHARVLEVVHNDINVQPQYSSIKPHQTNEGYYKTAELYNSLKKHRLTTAADTAAAHVPGLRHYNASSIPSMQYTEGLVGPASNQQDKPEGLASAEIIKLIAGGTFATGDDMAKDNIYDNINCNDIPKNNAAFFAIIKIDPNMFDKTLSNTIGNVGDKKTCLQESAGFSMSTRVFEDSSKQGTGAARYQKIMTTQCESVYKVLDIGQDEAKKSIVKQKVEQFIERIAIAAYVKTCKQFKTTHTNQQREESVAFAYLQQSYSNQRRQVMNCYLDNMMQDHINEQANKDKYNKWRASRLADKMKNATTGTLKTAYEKRFEKKAFIKVVEQRVAGYDKAVKTMVDENKKKLFVGALEALGEVVRADGFESKYGALDKKVLDLLPVAH